jgi:hypothetical protein
MLSALILQKRKSRGKSPAQRLFFNNRTLLIFDILRLQRGILGTHASPMHLALGFAFGEKIIRNITLFLDQFII